MHLECKAFWSSFLLRNIAQVIPRFIFMRIWKPAGNSFFHKFVENFHPHPMATKNSCFQNSIFRGKTTDIVHQRSCALHIFSSTVHKAEARVIKKAESDFNCHKKVVTKETGNAVRKVLKHDIDCLFRIIRGRFQFISQVKELERKQAFVWSIYERDFEKSRREGRRRKKETEDGFNSEQN